MAKKQTGLKSLKASKEKAEKRNEVVVIRSQMGTGISSRVFDAKTGEFLYSSWVNKNLKTSKIVYKRK